MEWKDIHPMHRNGQLTGYKVRYKQYFEKTFSLKKVDFGYATTVLLHLKPFTLYWIEISGYNFAGDGPTDYSIVKTLEGGNIIRIPEMNICFLPLSL